MRWLQIINKVPWPLDYQYTLILILFSPLETLNIEYWITGPQKCKYGYESWCYLSEVIIYHQITSWNKCDKHLMWVEEVWFIGVKGLGKTQGLKTWCAFSNKEYKNREDFLLFTLCCSKNNSLSNILSSFCIWAGNYSDLYPACKWLNSLGTQIKVNSNAPCVSGQDTLENSM